MQKQLKLPQANIMLKIVGVGGGSQTEVSNGGKKPLQER